MRRLAIPALQPTSWTALHPTCGNHRGLSRKEARRGTITTIGLDIAKSVFQVHGIDAAGEVLVRRRLSRGRILAFFEKHHTA